MPASFLRLCVLGLSLALSACVFPPRTTADATVIVHSKDGDELGVATEFGVVFLGRGQDKGEVEYTVFFGDGPSRERATIEPTETELFRLQPELRLPTAEIAYPDLKQGDSVLVRGHNGRDLWEHTARVAVNPKATGLLLETSGLGSLRNEDTGAGVFVKHRGQWVLVGLVQGRIRLPTKGAGSKEYIAVAGARELVGLGLYGLPRTPHRIPSDRHDAIK